MSSEQDNLADFVRKIIHEKKLSYRDVASKSGGLISHGTVSDIVAGKNTNPKANTIKSLAVGLSVPEEQLFAIARGKTPNEEVVGDERFEVISLKYRTLEKEDRRDVEVLLQTLERELERRNNAKN